MRKIDQKSKIFRNTCFLVRLIDDSSQITSENERLRPWLRHGRHGKSQQACALRALHGDVKTTIQKKLGERRRHEGGGREEGTSDGEGEFGDHMPRKDESSRQVSDLDFTETRRKSAHREESKKGGAATVGRRLLERVRFLETTMEMSEARQGTRSRRLRWICGGRRRMR